MSSKVILSSVLICVLTTHLGKCQNWCSLIKRDGKYIGLGAYHRWHTRHRRSDEFVMFNRDGKEWRFEIEGSPEINVNRMQIKINTTSVTNVTVDDTDVVRRFGMYILTKKPTEMDFIVDCWVRSPNKLHCQHIGLPSKEINKLIPFLLLERIVLMKHTPSEYEEYTNGRWLAVIDTNKALPNERVEAIYDPYKNQMKSCGSHSGKDKDCQVPSFITEMDASLFKGVNAIVDFNLGTMGSNDKSGWFVLFNIEGRPKYCFTREGRGISDSCRTADAMKSLFAECFITSLESPSTEPSTSEPFSDRDINTIAILVIIAVIILAIVVICGLVYLNKRKKKKPITKSTDTSTTAGTSQPSSIKTIPSKSSTKENK